MDLSPLPDWITPNAPLKHEAAPDAWGRIPVPNILPVGTCITSRHEVVEPLGFSPIAPNWPLRAARLPRYPVAWNHAEWRKTPLPPNLDPRFFNTSADDQLLSQISPDERITLEGIDPDHPQLVTHLPGIHLRAYVTMMGRANSPLALRADTLLIDSDAKTLTVTYRSHVPIDHPAREGWVVVTVDEAARIALSIPAQVTAATLDDTLQSAPCRSDERAAAPLEPDSEALVTLAPGCVPVPHSDGPSWLTPPSDAAMTQVPGLTYLPEPAGPGWLAGPASPDAAPREGRADALPFHQIEAQRMTLSRSALPRPPAELGSHPQRAFVSAQASAAPTPPLIPTQTQAPPPLHAQPLAEAVPILRGTVAGEAQAGAGDEPEVPPHIVTSPWLGVPAPLHAAVGAAQPEESVPPPLLEVLNIGLTRTAHPLNAARSTTAAELTSPLRPAAGNGVLPCAEADPEWTLSDFPLENCAAIDASIARRPAEKGSLLERTRLSPSSWARLRAAWEAEIRKEIRYGKKTLLCNYDAAYVAQLEKERGPITADNYATIAVELERGDASSALRTLDLPEDAAIRIQRTWIGKLSAEPTLGAAVRSAIARARAG